MTEVPVTEREVAVAEIWGKLLGDHAIGVRDDFFNMGGDSLIASQLIAFVRARFGVRVPMRRFLADPTISGLAAHIDELCAASVASSP